MRSKLQFINILSYLILVIVNFLAIQLPFFGKTPGDVSDLYPNLLTPADFTFRIWSLVYILLGIFVLLNAKQLFQGNYRVPSEISAIGSLFLISCLLNVSWLISWQSLHIPLSFVFIFCLWLVLILIYYRLAQMEKVEWGYFVPFSVYLAWVCIAALANLNVLLIDQGFSFFGLTEEYWTATLIGIGIGGTLLVLYLNKDIWFTLVLIWAFYGIFMKNKQLSSEPSWVVNMSLFAMVSLFIIGGIVGWSKWRKKR